ncbi:MULTISPECIES: DUF3330 domain-containing protein [Enterobacterales]|uniref:DUF3330 domain-containing protein n=1 Tax=Enterobacterales TaxID=91347 RepID=UPI001571B7DD|nr:MULTISPECIES: DUF3330 domain-containing protein [Enterobacterales]MDW7795425.1 DUF3330 domain-containing protein [Morganella morganii]
MISLSPPTICNSAAEYVEHFCGLECYQRFQARASTATETSVKPDACDSPPSG